METGTTAAPFPVAIPFDRSRLGEAFPLLQHGFAVRARTGVSVSDFLTVELGLEPGYVTGRITTIFLNGKPVDDLERSTISDGSVVALSAAMPGLVGATMRRGGFYAAFREGITDSGDQEAVSRGNGIVRIRIFNLLLRELGPHLLERGIIVTGEDRQWLSAELLAEIPATAWDSGSVLLSLRFGD